MPTALVIGARNLGFAVIERLLSDGWTVAGAARSPETLAKVRSAGAEALDVDVTDQASVLAALQALGARHGRVDLAVNAASPYDGSRSGPFGGGPLAQAAPTSFDDWATLPARGAFGFLSACARFMSAQGGPATIVQVTGGSARRAGCGEDPSQDLGANPRTRRRAVLAAQSWSPREVAEIPVRQQEQVPASHGHRTRSDCSTPGAAVRAVPAGLPLRCLLFRSSWLTMGAAARLLRFRSGGTAVGVHAAWLVRFQASSPDGSNLFTQRCWLSPQGEEGSCTEYWRGRGKPAGGARRWRCRRTRYSADQAGGASAGVPCRLPAPIRSMLACILRKDGSRAERRVWPGALAIELRPG